MESPIFVILCVLCFQRQSFLTYILQLSISDDIISTTIYDKQDAFDFDVNAGPAGPGYTLLCKECISRSFDSVRR